MNEVIKYFEGLEERIATLEAQLANLQTELDELKNRPAPEPQVIEKEVVKEVVVEKPVEVIKEVVVEKPVVVAAPIAEPAPVVEEPVIEEPVVEPEVIAEEPAAEPQPVIEEQASPKAAMYGKAVDDIRLAISLGTNASCSSRTPS